MTTYIHYGADNFIPDYFTSIRNIGGFLPKPEGGLWASRDGDSFGWKEWCEENHFNRNSLKHSFRFHLLPSARILTLTEPVQLSLLPKLKPWQPKDLTEMLNFPKSEVPSVEQLKRWFAPNPCFLDFEKISAEYDVLELRNAPDFRDCLPGWDCNSVIAMRPDVIELIEK